MKRSQLLIFIAASATLLSLIAFKVTDSVDDDRILSYAVDPKLQKVEFYWMDSNNKIIGSILNLKKLVESKKRKLLFATNGMYKQDNSPQGLFIENNKQITPLDTATGGGNFYMKPNGVFYITTDNSPIVCTTENFATNRGQIKYATQSGPMLVIDGKIHSAFKEGSANLNIRNGVGILPDNKLVFAMSKKEINFYDFANYFKNLGCKNALYLDGFVSRAYLPEKNWVQTDGNFGVMIGVTEDNTK